jgi:hypothetical protein
MSAAKREWRTESGEQRAVNARPGFVVAGGGRCSFFSSLQSLLHSPVTYVIFVNPALRAA